jgi:CheY-like chemotaxis protein
MSAPDKTHMILLADDDSDDRLLVQDALTEAGLTAEMTSVENGEQLLDYLYHRGKYSPPTRAPRPSLILLDLNMPRKSGREALREIKTDAVLRRIPVVVFTTSKADSDITALYDMGANSFVTKPFQFDRLVAVVSNLTEYWLETVELPD